MDHSSSKRVFLAVSLAGSLAFSSCQQATPPSHESEDITTDMQQTTFDTDWVTDAVTKEETTSGVAEETTTYIPETESPETSAPETDSPETEAETTPAEPTISEHDALMQLLAYNEAERAILAETAKKMVGLRVTYYADDEATQAVRSAVTPTAEAVFEAGDGARVAIFEGFITFPADGAYALTAPGVANGDPISIMEGENHVRTDDKLRVKAKAGAQYGIKLKFVRQDDQADQAQKS